MMLPIKSTYILLCSLAFSLLNAILAQIPPTRPFGLFDDGKTTTPLPIDEFNLPDSDVIVQIGLGKIAGKRVAITNISWVPDRDQRDVPLTGRGQIDWRPLPRHNNVTVFQFLGIPYAERPEADLRFKPPRRLASLTLSQDGIFRAFNYGPACYQNVEMIPDLKFDQLTDWQLSENCLFLNVFTPQVSSSVDRSMPVLVFIHGGSFQYGTGNDWPGHVLATKGVVVVTFNYRLGPFGFMSSGARGNAETGGNYGLEDQRLALEWVRDHIYAFGGDNGRVTLVGHGAGAAAAGMHMLSPFSANLFHAVGAMSGAEVAHEATIYRPDLMYNNTRKLGKEVGCSQPLMEEVWACILSRSANDIIKGTQDMIVEYNRHAFLPFVDGRVLPAPPSVMLRDKRVVTQVPYVTGVNQNDGSAVLLSSRSLAEYQAWTVDRNYFKDRVFDYTLKRNYTTNREAIIDAITYRYSFWPDLNSNGKWRLKFMEFASDAYYVAPVSQSAILHSLAGSFTYMYVNNYNISTGYRNPADIFLPWWLGVCHECDLYLLFGFPWMPKELLPTRMKDVTWTREDRNASEIFMAIWKKFSSDGDPNLRNDYIRWPHVRAQAERWYLSFNYTLNFTENSAFPTEKGRGVWKNYRWEAVAFWNEYLRELALLFTTTFSPTVATLRKELIGYKAATGVFVTLFMLALILALVFAYLLYERPRRKEMKRMRYEQFASTHTPIVPPRHRDPVGDSFQNSEHTPATNVTSSFPTPAPLGDFKSVSRNQVPILDSSNPQTLQDRAPPSYDGLNNAAELRQMGKTRNSGRQRRRHASPPRAARRHGDLDFDVPRTTVLD